MHQVFGLTDRPYCLSPIAIARDFTRKFIANPNVAPLEQKILNCVAELKRSHPMLIVEGTGHAGVGSCFGLSNARVAELLGAPVIIVTGGGIGRPLDEIALNLALFRQQNATVIGVILNKVLPEKHEMIRQTVARGMELLGTRLLGAIPYERALTFFNMGQLAEECRYKVLYGESALSNRIENTVVAAMEPQNVMPYIRSNTLVIAPGDRLDNILIATTVMAKDYSSSGGLVLTGGMEPHPAIAPLLRSSNVPVLLSTDDTFTVSSKIAALGFKIRSFDADKVGRLHALVEQFVDIPALLAALAD